MVSIGCLLPVWARIFRPFVLFFLLLASTPVKAEVTGSFTLTSDYLFNGVSQTLEDPAAQLMLNWSADNGVYLGAFASNVDFGDDTNLEADAYLGYYRQVTDNLGLDLGIAQYSYHGASYSSELNYAEAWLKFNYGDTGLNFWYAWDYFNTGAGHYIVMLNHNLELNEHFSILFGVDKSTSLDRDKWQWQENDKDYLHWQVTGTLSYGGFDWSLGIHDTDMESDSAFPADARAVLSISYSF